MAAAASKPRRAAMIGNLAARASTAGARAATWYLCPVVRFAQMAVWPSTLTAATACPARAFRAWARGRARLARRDPAPPRPAALAPWPGGEAARVPGDPAQVGGRADLRVAGPIPAARARLRAPARNRRGHDLRRDVAHNAQTARSGVLNLGRRARSRVFTTVGRQFLSATTPRWSVSGECRSTHKARNCAWQQSRRG